MKPVDEIDESDFVRSLLAKEKIEFLKMLEYYDARLFGILKAELKQGNKITYMYGGKEFEPALIVLLLNPFKEKYEITGLKFSSSNTPHDSTDYYLTPEPVEHRLCAPLKS